MPLFQKLLLIVMTTITFNTSAQAITLGVEATSYEPYYYLDKNKQYQGAARDIFDLFFKVHQLKFNYYPLPVPRLFNEFEKGHIDLKFPDNPLWSESLHTNVKVHYSDPVFNVTESLLVLKQSKPEVAKEDIKFVGTILGFSVPGIASAIENNEFETTQTKNIEQLLHMLVSERVQAVYFNKGVAKDLVKKIYPNKSLVGHSQYPEFKYAYLLSSIKHPKLIEAFNAFLVSHTKQVTDIKRRYGVE